MFEKGIEKKRTWEKMRRNECLSEKKIEMEYIFVQLLVFEHRTAIR